MISKDEREESPSSYFRREREINGIDRILSVLDKVPGYRPGIPKRSRREIQECLSAMEYDEEFIGRINVISVRALALPKRSWQNFSVISIGKRKDFRHDILYQ